MTVRPPFATTPPSGLPDLIEHDACALAAFATRDGKPSRSMLELRPDVAPDDGPPIRERGRRGRRERPAGRSAPARLAPPPRVARASTPPRPTTSASRSPTSSSTPPRTPTSRCRASRPIIGEHGFTVLWSGEGTVDRGALGPRAVGDPAGLLAARLPGEGAGQRGVDQLLPGDGPDRAGARLPRRLVLGERRRLQGEGPAGGDRAVLPRHGRARLRVVADHRPQPLLHQHLADVQAGAAVLDPRPQRRDQHDRAAARAERAARPADPADRLRQPGPQPPAREPHLREGPLACSRRWRWCCRRSSTRSHRLPAKLQDFYVHYREAIGPFAQGPVGADRPRRRRDASSRSTRMGLRPLWQIETDDDLRLLLRARRRPGGRADPRPEAARPGREGRPLVTGEDGAPVVLDYWRGPARGLPARQEPRRPAERRDARPPGRRPRAGGRRGVSPTTTSPAPRAVKVDDPSSAGRLDRERQAAAPADGDHGAEPIGSLGYDGPLGRAHARAPEPRRLLQGDGRRRHQPGDRPRARDRALLDPRRLRRAGPPIEGVEPDPPHARAAPSRSSSAAHHGVAPLSLPDAAPRSPAAQDLPARGPLAPGTGASPRRRCTSPPSPRRRGRDRAT